MRARLRNNRDEGLLRQQPVTLVAGGHVQTMANSRRIVVLDDDSNVLTAVERALKVHGFDAEVFDTVEAFRAGARLDEASCLVLDINLDGHCGIALRKELAGQGLSIPVIFITGADNGATKEAALQAGCAAYLQKPFLSRDLIDAIEQVA
jgi:FixJ family two-component response regulator